jgi:cytochrome d ubiquinol oxidase subunit I
MRVMAYLAGIVLLIGAVGMWLLYRRRLYTKTWFLRVATWAVILPFLMNTAGWLLTENGRQPWIVQGLQLTRHGVSPSASTTTVAISIIAFFLIYAALAAVAAVLMTRYSRRELAAPAEHDETIPAVSY